MSRFLELTLPWAIAFHGVVSYERDLNPYAAPIDDSSVGAPSYEESEFEPLASRGRRLLGAWLDGMLFVVGFLLAGLVGDFRSVLAGVGSLGLYTETGTFGLVAGLWVLGVLALQAVLVSTRGQSVGKILLKTRIVRLDGSPVGFLHGVVLRSWLMQLMSALPVVGSFISLVDAVMILRASRACLHDSIASTKVISLVPE